MFGRGLGRCGAIAALLQTGSLGTATAQNPFAADDQDWRSALEDWPRSLLRMLGACFRLPKQVSE